MAETVAQSAGVDISKDTLDIHLHPAGLTRRLPNDPNGLRSLLAWLRGFRIARIVFEPTGAYHHAFERRLGEAGLPLVKVNPRQARRFAQAIGRHAKTDAIDAAMLARLGAMLEPPPRPLPSKTLDDLKELHVARTALVKDRVAARNRSHVLRLPLLKRQAEQRLQHIDQQLAAIEAAMAELVAADPPLAGRLDILLSIPGIGRTTALAILIEMPELGAIENKAAASLAGLAPIARDSGRKLGRRFIQGGRAGLRQALYMPALVAARFNPDLKAKYQALIQAGKPPKLAITAIMRKLLILANALLRGGRIWSPDPA
jgi:transposase